jgi:ubiquinone/menaquinone biosynthesis C-methylase UbiE
MFLAQFMLIKKTVMATNSLPLNVRAAYELSKLMPRSMEVKNVDTDSFFDSEFFHKSTPEGQANFLYQSAKLRYDYELENRTLEKVFQTDLTPYLSGRVFLDFGCFTAGTTIAWHEKYNFSQIYGFDIDETFAKGARIFSEQQGIKGDFIQAYGENLPYLDESIESIIALDVLEHVRNVSDCLKECYRILKPGGHLLIVFPPFFHPFAHHLKTTYTPFLHWIFSGKTLKEANNAIVAQKGEEYSHYLVDNVPEYYRLMSLNGITVSKFSKVLKEHPWELILEQKHGLPFFGKRVEKSPVLRTVRDINNILCKFPVLDEITLDRVSMILKKN